MARTISLVLMTLVLTTTSLALGVKKPSNVLHHSIARYGYPVELHKVTTADGYILSLARIPGKSPDKKPLLILHGLLSCSIDWTVQGPERSLSFIAADEGYDVWLGNVRGNTFSKEHEKLSSKDREYWNFSFHEIGLYDLSAMVDYIRGNTSSDTIHYMGHSQGGAAFLVLTSMRPAYNAKFASVHLMAPAAYIHHATTPVVDYASRTDELEMFAKLTRSYEIGGRGAGSSVDLVYAGYKTGLIPTNLVLINIWYLVGAHDSINRTVLGEILANTPAGCSVYQLLHFAQIYRAKSFQMYDYGAAANIQRYGSRVPPEYPLHNVTAPIVLYYSQGDNFVPAQDVEELADQLPNVLQKHQIGSRKWNHIDFMYHVGAHRLYRMMVASLRDPTREEQNVE
uniref:Lipase n=1 Tax=Anopheles farauti TaxID=69004 RepID=A0A182QAY7_9DIPT